MEMLNKNVGLVSNFEVYQFLARERVAAEAERAAASRLRAERKVHAEAAAAAAAAAAAEAEAAMQAVGSAGVVDEVTVEGGDTDDEEAAGGKGGAEYALDEAAVAALMAADMGVYADDDEINERNVMENVLDYLTDGPTPTCGERADAVAACVRALQGRFEGLTAAELLQLLNTAPRNEVVVHLIVEECAERFTGEEIDSLLAVIGEHLVGRVEQEAGEEGEDEDGEQPMVES